MAKKATSNVVKMLIAEQLLRLSAGKTTTATVTGSKLKMRQPNSGNALGLCGYKRGANPGVISRGERHITAWR